MRQYPGESIRSDELAAWTSIQLGSLFLIHLYGPLDGVILELGLRIRQARHLVLRWTTILVNQDRA
jgi:hypothetical protein